jgi:ABC-2 type transport system permease protein
MSATPTVELVDPARRARSGGLGLTPLAALYMLTLRQHMHGKRWLVLGVLFLTPAVLALIVRLTAPDVPAIVEEFLFVFMLIPQALLPLLALLYASGIIQDEQEEQTFTYILIRPIAKWAIYVVKMLATLTTTVALSTVFTALTYLVIYLGTDAGAADVSLRCLKAVGVHALAVTAYCCLFGLMSLLTRWTLVLGFLYSAIFEGLLANLPFGVRLLTIIYYARLIAYRSMDFLLAQPRGGKEDIAADAWQLDVKADPNLLDHPSLTTCLTVLLVASLVGVVLGALLCWRREFHVKTPEGG